MVNGMDLVSNLVTGFAVALTPANLGFALIGCLIGTLIGVLPGIGPIATIAMLLPLTFHLVPVSGLIMLAGIFYGAQYGGSTTAILVNMPGETSSVVTCIDGHQMARQGRAGAALAIAALGSFFAGSVATLVIATLAPPLASIGQSFGAPEYFSLMLLGLIAAVVLAHGAFVKAVAMIVLGLILGLVGTDGNSGGQRFTMGFTQLADGIDFAVLAIGVFGVGEIIANLARGEASRSLVMEKVTRLWPTRDDFARAWPAVLRGTALGSVLGVLPGGGATLSSFAAYVFEKKLSRAPQEFGRGAVEGVAGPESANNAGAQTSFIPMLTLGIPGNAVMALMIGALMIHGIQPGPQVMTERPDLFWGMVASMWVGNLMLVIINLPLIGVWVQLLKVPYRFLYLAVLLFCAIGVYTISNSAFAVVLAALFGVIGFVFYRLQCEPAPLVLGFVLGPLMEENLRRAMLISSGDPVIFLARPISAGLIAAAAILLVIVALPAIRSRREEAFQED
jgi:putative tricarboxylic transport membrane protein